MRLAAALALLAAASCAPALAPPPPPAARSPRPSTTSPAPAPPAVVARDFDPLPLGLSADGETKLCDDHLRIAAGLADQIRALRGAPPDALTFDTTAGRFDDILLEIDDATELPYLLAFIHSDAAVREAARLCEPKGVDFRASLYLDPAVAAVLGAYAAKANPLTGERARLLADILRDFRRNGLALPADKQARLRDIGREVTSVEQSFMGNVAAAVGDVQVPTGALLGLPPAYIAAHESKGRTLVEITTDSRDYDPFITYSSDRKAALDLYVQFTNRGGDENLRLLDRLLRLRAEKAKLLGYATWADYVIEPRMAKTPARVRDFLDRVRARAKAPARAEYTVLVGEHGKLGGRTDHLPPPDRYYLEARVRADHDHYDAQELSNYLEVGAVKKGVLDLTARLFGLEYREIAAPAWDPDVTTYEVWSAGKRLGRLYLDLYARPGKYDQEAMFPVRTAKRFPDGTYQEPMAALVCSFPRPGPGGAAPALLTHEDLVSLFHEMGHVLHQLLTRSELAAYSGAGVVRDFVEVPSQLLEEWAYSREALDLFARHVKTGARIPDALFTALEKSRLFGRALDVQHQLFLSTLDLELHTREPGFDLMKLVEETQAANENFQFVPGTHLPSSFTYLVTYAAAYYSYPWALSLARDALGRFKKEGMFDPKVAASFREEVLEKGGGADEEGMLTRFLGRAPSEDAFYAYLEGKDGSGP